MARLRETFGFWKMEILKKKKQTTAMFSRVFRTRCTYTCVFFFLPFLMKTSQRWHFWKTTYVQCNITSERRMVFVNNGKQLTTFVFTRTFIHGLHHEVSVLGIILLWWKYHSEARIYLLHDILSYYVYTSTRFLWQIMRNYNSEFERCNINYSTDSSSTHVLVKKL